MSHNICLRKGHPLICYWEKHHKEIPLKEACKICDKQYIDAYGEDGFDRELRRPYYKLWKVTCSFIRYIKAESKERAMEILKEEYCDPFCEEHDCTINIEEEKE